MNKTLEFILKALDDGQTPHSQNIPKPTFNVGKWFFLATSLVTPLAASIFASMFMDVNSREFTIVLLPLLINILLILCWILHNLFKAIDLSTKEKIGIACVPPLVILSAYIYFV